MLQLNQDMSFCALPLLYPFVSFLFFVPLFLFVLYFAYFKSLTLNTQLN